MLRFFYVVGVEFHSDFSVKFIINCGVIGGCLVYSFWLMRNWIIVKCNIYLVFSVRVC